MDYKANNKYETQIKLRKAKLDTMRKERELLQLEKKVKHVNEKQQNLIKICLKSEIQERAQQINDREIDKIQYEINKFETSSKFDQALNSEVHIDENKPRYRNKNLNLKCYNLPIMEIPPILITTYSKQTQTTNSQYCVQNYEKDYKDDDIEYHDDQGPLGLLCKFSSNLPPGILSPGLPKLMDIPPAITAIAMDSPWNYSKLKSKQILGDQSEDKTLCDDFCKSLKRVSLVVEHVLNTNKNIYVDYIGGVTNDEKNNNLSSICSLNQIFYNKNMTANRCITSIDWSPQYCEKIAVAYYKNEESSSWTGNDILVWNRNLNNQTPEYAFHCHSSVTCVCFSKFNSNLLIGATYSGQIVLWDNRAKTSIPVQCTKLNSKAHTQPIYGLRIIGNDDSSHNIISISSDGKLCSWNLDMLALPLDVLQVQLDVADKIKKPIGVTSMDFSANGVNSLVLGGEDGCAYSAFRYGYESGINNRYEKHDAPITSISSHYNQSLKDFGDLFLTSSIDGSIKLWSLECQRPLHSFTNNFDYVMDVAWSPVHPALFVAADGSGHLDLYNLNENIEDPIKSIKIEEEAAINRLAWSSSGQYVAAGTENSMLYLYNIVDDLANPENNEWIRFNRALIDIKNYYIE